MNLLLVELDSFILLANKETFSWVQESLNGIYSIIHF